MADSICPAARRARAGLRPAGPSRRARARAGEHARGIRDGALDRRDDARARSRDDQGRRAGRQPRPHAQSGSYARTGRQIPRARRPGDPLAHASPSVQRYDVGRLKPGSAYAASLPEQRAGGRRAHSGADRAVRSGAARAAPSMCASTSRPRSRRPPAPKRRIPETFAAAFAKAVREAGPDGARQHAVVRLAHAWRRSSASRPRSSACA